MREDLALTASRRQDSQRFVVYGSEPSRLGTSVCEPGNLFSMDRDAYLEKGWLRFGYDSELFDWVAGALPAARKAVVAEQNARWLSCGGTWFVGVNALPNDTSGAVDDSGPLRGAAVDFCRDTAGGSTFAWDRAQVSVCYPRYPQPMQGESAAAFRYRRERDAAHVDGLLAEGEGRRRHLREHHAFILGVPMLEFSPDASPFVVWEGSHEIVRAAVAERLAAVPPERWGDEDVTQAYHRIRRTVFETCKRVEIFAQPGEAFVVHRLSLHGIAPWGNTATAASDGRMICYFRPLLANPVEWLDAP